MFSHGTLLSALIFVIHLLPLDIVVIPAMVFIICSGLRNQICVLEGGVGF